jgi:hypothetical protein
MMFSSGQKVRTAADAREFILYVIAAFFGTFGVKNLVEGFSSIRQRQQDTLPAETQRSASKMLEQQRDLQQSMRLMLEQQWDTQQSITKLLEQQRDMEQSIGMILQRQRNMQQEMHSTGSKVVGLERRLEAAEQNLTDKLVASYYSLKVEVKKRIPDVANISSQTRCRKN